MCIGPQPVFSAQRRVRPKQLDFSVIFPKPDGVLQPTLIHGDAREIPLKERAVDMIWTSPPWWQARDYDLGANQLGLEANLRTYVANLADVFVECGRVLKPDG